MKKITVTIFYFIIVLFSHFATFAQSVTLNTLLLNGQNLDVASQINIGTTNTISNISFNVEVKLLASPSDSNPGAITIYYKRNSSYSPVVCNGGNQTNVLFLGNTTSSHSFVIALTNAQFDASGGMFYAEYKTYSGIVYKSANIPIVKTTQPTTNPGNPPTTTNPDYYKQYVPYGGIPLLPQLATSVGTGCAYDWVTASYYSISDMPFSSEQEIYYTTYLKQRLNCDDGSTDGNSNGINAMYIDVDMPFLGDASDPYLLYRRVSVNNYIKSDQYILAGEVIKEIVGDPVTIRRYRLNTNVENNITSTLFKWQKRIVKPAPFYYNYATYITAYGWKDIPGATQANYTPTSVLEVTEFRRLALDFRNSAASSNVVTIYPLSTSLVNTICCDQVVYSDIPAVSLIGSNAPSGSNFAYHWQYGIISRGTAVSWTDIDVEGDTKDYLPYNPNRSTSEIYYRRFIIEKSTNKYYTSNTVKVKFNKFSSARMSSPETLTIKKETNTVAITPNPASTFIKVESQIDLASFSIKVIDMSGRVIAINSETDFSSNSRQIDISQLPKGIYSIIIENETSKVVKKIIKN